MRAREVEVSCAVDVASREVDVVATFAVAFDPGPYDRGYDVELVQVEEDAPGAQPSQELADALAADAKALGRAQDAAIEQAKRDAEAAYDDARERGWCR